MTFIRAIAKCDEMSRDCVPSGFLHDCWTKLVIILKHLYEGIEGKGLKNTSTDKTDCTTDKGMTNVIDVSSNLARERLSMEMQGDIKETLAVIISTLSFAEFSQIVYNLVDRVVSR